MNLFSTLPIPISLISSKEETITQLYSSPNLLKKKLSAVDDDAISTLSRSVFDKLMEKIDCERCEATLETSMRENQNVKYPSDLFDRNFKKMFCFIDETVPFICAEKNLKSKIAQNLENLELESMGCEDHFDDVGIKFKEFCTIFGIILFCKKVNDILGKKNTTFSEDSNAIEQLAFSWVEKQKRIGKYTDALE